jgi:diacylglycerol O-acyltransferase / wax synthase
MDRYTRNVLVVEPDPVERERLAAALEGEGFELPPGADEHDLLELIEELRIQRFEPSCPLWRVWLITGLPEGRVAMFVKLHHAVADGMAAMSTIGAFLDADPDKPIPPARSWAPAPPPSDRALLIDNALRHLRTVGLAVSAVARPRTALWHAREA